MDLATHRIRARIRSFLSHLPIQAALGAVLPRRSVFEMMRKGPFPPSQQPPMETDQLSGAVTWFSTSKGFGFIKPSDGSEDVFVHVSVVQRAGLEILREGATVNCEVAPGKKGRQVMRLLDVDDSTATPESADGGFRSGPRPQRSAYAAGPAGEPGEGAIKWFNATKGFGFITPDVGGKDVFLHASVVRRAGLMDVQPGQRVRYTAVEREKGPEARTIEITDGADGGDSGGSNGEPAGAF